MMNSLKKYVQTRCSKIEQLQKEIGDKFEGRSVRILSNYNAQPYGNSKPSLKGKVFKITSAHIDSRDCYFFLEGYEYGCSGVFIDEVEFLKEGSENVGK